MWDYQHPYPGGTAVTSCQLPRPLYFKGNPAGKPISDPGIDVKAAKRTLSRLGRWPWVEGGDFSTEFTRDFALGKSGGHVADSGIAGYQRQMNIDDSGQVGEKTYNSWRNARIPEGLPHAGEPGMDATAVNMFEEAWLIYKGKPTPPPANTNLRAQALQRAKGQLGVKESPSGSNQCKYCDWYGMIGPWCAMFCTWCYENEGDSPAFVRGSRYAYVPYIVSDAQNTRYGLSVTSSPIPGDLVCYDWDGNEYDHVGLFESGNSNNWNAIEGNTSTSNNSNGGEVMRRSRSRSQATKVCFVRVAEP
jgi:hypothetical protein